MKWKSDRSVHKCDDNTRLNTLQFIENEKSFIEAHDDNIDKIYKTESNFSESAPTPDNVHVKFYKSECFLSPKTVPYWYNETLTLNINSTKRNYQEIVYFKNKLVPYRWSETLIFDLKPSNLKSELNIALDGLCYVPLDSNDSQEEHAVPSVDFD